MEVRACRPRCTRPRRRARPHPPAPVQETWGISGGYGSLVAGSSKGGVAMATAIIGIGNIGEALARNLVRGGEPVVLAAKDEANAAALAQELGQLARAASVE